MTMSIISAWHKELKWRIDLFETWTRPILEVRPAVRPWRSLIVYDKMYYFIYSSLTYRVFHVKRLGAARVCVCVCACYETLGIRKVAKVIKKRRENNRDFAFNMSPSSESRKVFFFEGNHSALLGPSRLKRDTLYFRHQVRLLSEWNVHDNQTFLQIF